jgi:iron(III) transport system ATP-binding protein
MDHGVILQAGTPEEVYQQPATRFVAEFLGHCNFLTGRVLVRGAGTVVGLEPGGAELALADPELRAGEMVQIALRPESIELGGDLRGSENTLEAEIQTSSFLGDHYVYELIAGGVELTVTSTRAAINRHVSVRIPPAACRVLAREDSPTPSGAAGTDPADLPVATS